MGFQNEKDHPEVAPSQFEINYCYAEAVAAADQIQIRLTLVAAAKLPIRIGKTQAKVTSRIFDRL